jgi:hypothetical protein
MILKGYVKRVAELKKKSKEQLINYIIEKERKRNDKLTYLVNRVITLSDLLESYRKDELKLEKKLSLSKGQLIEKEKENNILTGSLKIAEQDYMTSNQKLTDQSKNIVDAVLMKFNEIKTKIITQLVDDKVALIQKELNLQKNKDLIAIFEHLGVSKEQLIAIMSKFNLKILI